MCSFCKDQHFVAALWSKCILNCVPSIKSDECHNWSHRTFINSNPKVLHNRYTAANIFSIQFALPTSIRAVTSKTLKMAIWNEKDGNRVANVWHLIHIRALSLVHDISRKTKWNQSDYYNETRQHVACFITKWKCDEMCPVRSFPSRSSSQLSSRCDYESSGSLIQLHYHCPSSTKTFV